MLRPINVCNKSTAFCQRFLLILTLPEKMFSTNQQGIELSMVIPMLRPIHVCNKSTAFCPRFPLILTLPEKMFSTNQQGIALSMVITYAQTHSCLQQINSVLPTVPPNFYPFRKDVFNKSTRYCAINGYNLCSDSFMFATNQQRFTHCSL